MQRLVSYLLVSLYMYVSVANCAKTVIYNIIILAPLVLMHQG